MTDTIKVGKNYVYIVKCADGTLYTGWTNDLEKRVSAHNSGAASKYTRARTPVALVYSEKFDTRQEAMSRETEIKKFTKARKNDLINSKK